MKAFRLAVAVCFALLFSLPSFSQIASTRLGDGTGEDWEPAIMLFDGSYVYALWPHFGAITTCPPAWLVLRRARNDIRREGCVCTEFDTTHD